MISMFDNSWFSCANELFGQTVCITWFAQHKDMPVPEFESSIRQVLKSFAESRNKWTLDDELLIWALAEFISAAENGKYRVRIPVCLQALNAWTIEFDQSDVALALSLIDRLANQSNLADSMKSSGKSERFQKEMIKLKQQLSTPDPSTKRLPVAQNTPSPPNHISSNRTSVIHESWRGWNAIRKLCYRLFGTSPYRKYGLVMGISARRRPKCLASFLTDFTPAPAQEVSEKNSFINYKLHCSCGGDHFYILEKSPEKQPQVFLRCAQCDRDTLLFDPRRDGYDSHLCSPTQIESAVAVSATTEAYAMIVSLEYSICDDEATAIPHFFTDAPELFTWIRLYGIKNGEPPKVLFDWECA